MKNAQSTFFVENKPINEKPYRSTESGQIGLKRYAAKSSDYGTRRNKTLEMKCGEIPSPLKALILLVLTYLCGSTYLCEIRSFRFIFLCEDIAS